MFSLKNKVIVITGATGVLGSSFAEATASAGARIVILGRDKVRAEQCLDNIQKKGGEAMIILADVLDMAQLNAAAVQILHQWGKIDGLVNAAGGNISSAMVSPDQDLFDADFDATKKVIDLNLYGTMLPTQIFGRCMTKSGKGSIVNISSLAAQRAITRGLGYTVAKTAIEGYTKWMASELALRYNGQIRVNAIAPGVFLTFQNKDLLKNTDGSWTDRTQKFLNNTPFRRLGEPEELNGTLIYLLSDASAFVTGETILVDGGFNAFSGV